MFSPDEINKVDTTKNKGEVAKKNTPVQVNNLAVKSDLNLKRQYEERIGYCDRVEIKCVEKAEMEEEAKKLVKLIVNTGMFEVLKKDLVKELTKSQNVTMTQNKQPKVDKYGAKMAEIKYQIYFTFSAQGNKYEAKVDLFNTTCTILIDSIGRGAEKARIEGFSIAEFCYHTFFKTVLDSLMERYDIKHINKFCKQMVSSALSNLF